jgi:hypothetical protein
MAPRIRKIAAWTIGMAFAGFLLGGKGSYSVSLAGEIYDCRYWMLAGAAAGFALGHVFSRGLSKSVSK